MNSQLKSLNIRAASFLAALSLSLTGVASLAQSSATTQSYTGASSQNSSSAGTHASSSASTQASSSASYQASTAATQHTATAAGSRAGFEAGIKPGTSNNVASGGPQTVVAKAPDLVALQGPTLITQKGPGWKTASTFLDLKDGQQSLPLTFTVTNGANNGLKMQGIRIKINGHDIVTEKTFKGKDSVSISLSDIIGAGQTQLIIDTFGPTNATLSWVLTTLKIKVSDIKPVNCKIGETVKISGKNFPTEVSAYRLQVDQKSAKITKATGTFIDFVVPEGLTGGKKTVTLYIAGVKCDPLYIKVSAAPEVSGCNLLGAAPGGQVIIQGKGFSTTASENTVIFKNVDGNIQGQATPTAATDTELTVSLPMDYPCPSEILCTVKTNGQESAKGVTFSCSQRVIDKNILIQ